MAEDDERKLSLGDVINEFCAFMEHKAETGEDVGDILPEIQKLRDSIEESSRFMKEYPTMTGLIMNMAETISWHERKLTMIKDILVNEGILIEVEGDSPEDARANLEKQLSDEALNHMIKNMDKKTVH